MIVVDNVFKYIDNCEMFSIQFCSFLFYIVLLTCWLETLYTSLASRGKNFPCVSGLLHGYRTITKIAYSNKI